MRSIVLVVPGRLAERTGGYLYDQRIVDGLRRRGWAMEVLELDSSFPYPSRTAIGEAERALGRVRAGTIAIVDSLALGAMPDVIAHYALRLHVIALVHLPLSATWGLDADTARRFEEGERRALRAASMVVVTGRATLPLIAKYSIPADRIVVVEPGTDRAPLARGSGRPALELLSVATLNAGKGHQQLLTALSSLQEFEWRLTCAGSLTRDPGTVDLVRNVIADHGLGERVILAGELGDAELAMCYDRSDVFVLATQLETYGMAVAEALAHGLPVVATNTGAIPELLKDGAGLVVPVGDVAALHDALQRVLSDAALRARLGEGARRVREELPTWDDTSGRIAVALHSMVAHG